MMSITQLILAALPWLLLLLTPKGFCDQRVDCQWGPYGDWSECDGCTKLQTRSRAMAVYAQFGGNPCNGGRTETRSCVTTQSCPLEDGCGNRFRCPSGKCISQSLLCNGDKDCEGVGQDERVCEVSKYMMCLDTVRPPNIDLLGLGFDVVSGKQRASVINTEAFGGQCRVFYSIVHNDFYRLPLSTTLYRVQAKPQNNFTDEMFTSKWHYALDTVNTQTVTGTTTRYNNYDFQETDDQNQSQKLLVLKSDIEVVHFQSNSHQQLPISEEFWRALVKLPSVYDYAAYREVLDRFGTHYLSEGSLGGSFKIIAKIDEETEKQTVSEQDTQCEKTKRWFLIFPTHHVDCRSDQHQRPSLSGKASSNLLQKVEVKGGDIQHITALEAMQLSDTETNWKTYSQWAESLRLSPVVTKQTLRPLSELVKEVECAAVKRLYLRRAIEQYLTESDSCHCRPCSNNGMVFMDGDECKCICKPGTSGLACEQGTEVGGQQGVIHGSWACWSAWSSCSGGRRSRSRTCSNPTPQNGGQHCVGEATDESDCDLQHLKTTEPQCFDQTLPASPICGNPPVLINGYILDPKDVYFVGSKVQYTCTDDYSLLGEGTTECTANQTWSNSPGVCTVSKCHLRSLSDDITASPLQKVYGQGDTVTLSCPAGRQLLGEATLTCDSSLNFSPNPADIKCSPDSTLQQRISWAK